MTRFARQIGAASKAAWVRNVLRSARATATLYREFAKDRARFQDHMAPEDRLMGGRIEGLNLEAQVTKDYHRVEKGLALKEPRRPFGKDVERRLATGIAQSSDDAAYLPYAETALDALRQWNAGGSASEVVSPPRELPDRGIRNPDAFFRSRHSVRDFAARPVDARVVSEAVELAIHTPSVCNRQAWRVRLYVGAAAARILTHQNGNRGFRESIPAVALVTVDVRLFTGIGERNQPWIEGGLFSMSFVYALHALGLDTCMLNMSVLNDDASKLRTEFHLPEPELIIMMIAMGHGREGHKRARSPRRPVREVLINHES